MLSANRSRFFSQILPAIRRTAFNPIQQFSTAPKSGITKEQLADWKINHPSLYDNHMKMQSDCAKTAEKPQNWTPIDSKILEELLETEKTNRNTSVY